MRIATNAGGLFGFTMTVFDLEVDIGNLEKTVEETISALGSVRNATTQINGGVGVLQPALDALNARIRTEEEKLEGIREVKRESIEFLDFMTNTDAEVAKRVRQNKEEFYQAYPHLKPPDPPKEKNLFEKGVEYFGGLYQQGKEFVTEKWNAAKDWAVETWDNLKNLATEAWNGLVEWYETSGAKEILGIVKDVALFTVGAVCTFIPPLTAVGVAIGATLVAAGAIDMLYSTSNKAKAFEKKRDALSAERSGDTEKAKRLRQEADEYYAQDSLREKWANDGETNGWDVLGTAWTVLEVVDLGRSIKSGDLLENGFNSFGNSVQSLNDVNGLIGTTSNVILSIDSGAEMVGLPTLSETMDNRPELLMQSAVSSLLLPISSLPTVMTCSVLINSALHGGGGRDF